MVAGVVLAAVLVTAAAGVLDEPLAGLVDVLVNREIVGGDNEE
jgi:hypothetical protein